MRDGLATWEPRLDTDGIVGALDESSVLVLPSRSEGMGRVVIEAQLRGRPVLGSDVGGIPDLVTDGVDGVLVEPDPDAIGGVARAAARGSGGARAPRRRRACRRRALARRRPEEYAERVRALVAG